MTAECATKAPDTTRNLSRVLDEMRREAAERDKRFLEVMLSSTAALERFRVLQELKRRRRL